MFWTRRRNCGLYTKGNPRGLRYTDFRSDERSLSRAPSALRQKPALVVRRYTGKAHGTMALCAFPVYGVAVLPKHSILSR